MTPDPPRPTAEQDIAQVRSQRIRRARSRVIAFVREWALRDEFNDDELSELHKLAVDLEIAERHG